MKFFAIFFLLGFLACDKTEQTPEAALKEFIDLRIGKVIDRDFIVEKVTGKMLATFKNMPEDQFKTFADMKNIQGDSFKILSKTCAESKCSLTYSVGYTTKVDDKPQFISEVRKTAELIKVNEKWLIAEVNNLQTSHESLEAINAF